MHLIMLGAIAVSFRSSGASSTALSLCLALLYIRRLCLMDLAILGILKCLILTSRSLFRGGLTSLGLSLSNYTLSWDTQEKQDG